LKAVTYGIEKGMGAVTSSNECAMFREGFGLTDSTLCLTWMKPGQSRAGLVLKTMSLTLIDAPKLPNGE
jgi:hypothetical protein